ncbi:hypothetical protein HDU86_001748 [Geranomyces michiganensis]|nr:hypothetical protein HDU86_001748 [Geranomyces michiganensis]
MTASMATQPLAPIVTPQSLTSPTLMDRNDPRDINILRTYGAVTNSPFKNLMRTRRDKQSPPSDTTTGEDGTSGNNSSVLHSEGTKKGFSPAGLSAGQDHQQHQQRQPWKTKTTSASTTRPNVIRKNVFVLADRGANAAAAADGSSDEAEDDLTVNPETVQAIANQLKHSPKRQLADSISVAKHGAHWRTKRAIPSVEMWERGVAPCDALKVAKLPASPDTPPAKPSVPHQQPATPDPRQYQKTSDSINSPSVEGFWPILKAASPKPSPPSGLSNIAPAPLSLPSRDTVKMPAAAEGDFGAGRASSSASIDDGIQPSKEIAAIADEKPGDVDGKMPESATIELGETQEKDPTATEDEPMGAVPEVVSLLGDEAPDVASRVPHSVKIAMRRVWSPSRLQVPSLSAGSIFDDPDWMQAFMPGAQSVPSLPSEIPVKETHKPVIPPSPCTPGPAPAPTRAPDESFTEKHAVTHGPPGGAPRRRDSLGHAFEPELASLADSLDEGFEDDPSYHFQTLTRHESLGSLVDDIMGRPQRRSAGKSVRFGCAWNGELESRRLIFASPEPGAETYEGRIGVLYLQINTLQMQSLQPNACTEVTINIRQNKAERLYEWELTRILPPGVTTLNLDFDCEIPLLPSHPVSLVFYVKTLSDGRSSPSQPSSYSGTSPVQSGNGCAPSSLRPTHGRKNSLISFFRSKRPEDGSLTPPSPPRLTSKRNSYAVVDIPNANGAKDAPPQLIVAESDPFTPEQWTSLLHAASGNLVDYVFTARLLEWKSALVHGAAVGSVACRVGFLPFLDSRMHRSLWPKRVHDYAMGVRVAEWNEALSMEGYLWQLGGDVRTVFQRRYYKLHGPLLSVYDACSNPRVTDVPWEEYDFDPDTQLPLPLEQSHGLTKIASIELANLESWCSYEKPRTRHGSVSVPFCELPKDAEVKPLLHEHERTTLPTPSAAIVLLFKDGREIILGVDPDEVGRYQLESDRFAKKSLSSDSSAHSLLQVQRSSASQLTLMQWRPLDIADMWKQAFNEVLNGVKYDIPVWVQPLKEWKAEGGTLIQE